MSGIDQQGWDGPTRGRAAMLVRHPVSSSQGTLSENKPTLKRLYFLHL
jgi:hypothetical protein